MAATLALTSAHTGSGIHAGSVFRVWSSDAWRNVRLASNCMVSSIHFCNCSLVMGCSGGVMVEVPGTTSLAGCDGAGPGCAATGETEMQSTSAAKIQLFIGEIPRLVWIMPAYRAAASLQKQKGDLHLAVRRMG